MMFDVQTVKAIQNGKKCVTRRLTRTDGRRPAVPGKIHTIKIDRTDRKYGTILITDCTMEKLGDITPNEVKMEGFERIGEYINYFKKVNGTDNPNTMVWRVEFELADNPKDYHNIGLTECQPNNPNEKDDLVFIADLDMIFEDIIWDLTKYKCNFHVSDGNIDKDNQEFWFDLHEEYENDTKPTTIKEFKDWIQSEDCDWFYEVDRWEEYEWGLKIFLKF